MQKKRPRKNGTVANGTAPDGTAPDRRAPDGPVAATAPAGRRVRVRRRLVIGVAVAGLAVLVAGAPAVLSASADLKDSQELVTLADQSRQTLTLAHLLGDERDAVTAYVAKGRPGGARGEQAAGVKERTAGTDRQLAEVQADADEELAQALGRVGAVRTEAIEGKDSALAAHQAYSGVIAELLAPSGRLAELTPPRAADALVTARPLAALGQAVEQASATRGLLLAGLSVPGGDKQPGTAFVDELTAAAQRARVRELGALDDFARAARPDVRQSLTATVTGPEVKTADDYLKRLTDRPALSPADRKLDPGTVGAALTARVDRMRSVEATLAGQRATALAALRDDDVTALEVMVAFLGVLFLLTLGISTAIARSLTRPLSVLRRGAARLATPEGSVEPVRFTGRNDEFAEVVRHLNAVRDQTVSLHTRIAGLDADRRRLIGRNEALSAGREALEEELAQLRAGLAEHRRIMSTTSVSLSLRTLGLVERQLAVIEELESEEPDPDRLSTLFKLDHLATVMRRHNENLLVLAGQEHGHGQGLPVPLVDVMRAAVSEIERYERVDLGVLPSYTQVAGHAADDISHVLAELLENATTFSPPDAKVKVSGWLLDSGDVVLSVVDEGIGITGDRLATLNERLATPDAYDEEPESEHGLGLGLYVAGRLAARHGVSAELRALRHGGTEALVVVPATLLPATPPASPVHTLGAPGAPALHLPGVIAEANENTLPARVRGLAALPPETPAAPEEPAATEAPAAPEPQAAAAVPAVDPEPASFPEPEHEPEHEAEHAPESFPEPEPASEPAPASFPEPEPAHETAQASAAEPPARVAPEPAPAGFAPPAGQLPPTEQVFRVPAPVEVPAEQVFRVRPQAQAAAEVPVEQPEAPAEVPAEQVFRVPPQAEAPAAYEAEPEEVLTDKGLPKRSPRVVSAGREEEVRPAPGRVDADELRRRLGGFYRGAQDGRRVVEAELAQDPRLDPRQGPPQDQGQTDRGDTAQEART
ncbi:nitrate- and nitrite sensing domain-containing protein [Streptomyces sp. NBC_00347]|uniref:sensor histidine kinase n=1 Tax=Streptomyces sp. NBC_00347 TaxID=2975721 RepID=UPI002250E7FB|nr:nitrate- and nitrite sensing domain-containing protein [Streptomyces sp. NBC_00347]MCX5122508.1 nitrate- and nitrite sensing domain-containing protein [Streptomyces sp. NBC_00347]